MTKPDLSFGLLTSATAPLCRVPGHGEHTEEVLWVWGDLGGMT